jgi:hypothetical protein
MILAIIKRVLFPDNTTLAELQRKAEDGTITVSEMRTYMQILDGVNRISDHSNRIARTTPAKAVSDAVRGGYL